MRGCCARRSRSRPTGPDGPCVFAASGQGDPVRRATCAPTSRGSDDPAAELGDQETLLPEAERRRPGHGRWAARPRRRWTRKGHETIASAALHRCVAGEAPRGGRHRPPVDVRVDHLDDRAARVRLAAGQGARSDASRRTPSRGCSRSTSPRSSSWDSPGMIEEDLDEIARASATATTSSPRSTTGWRPDWPGLQAAGREPGRRSTIRSSRSASTRTPGAPVVVRIGRFGPYVQVGEGDDAPQRLGARRYAAGRPQPRARDRARRVARAGAGRASGTTRRRACRSTS